MTPLPNPITIGEITYDQYSVAPFYFHSFVEMLAVAREEANDDDDFQRARNRATIKSQVTLHADGQRKHKLTDIEVANLTMANGKELLAKSFDAPGKAGEIISGDADGISKSIIYKLGEPIKTAAASITELEFLAKTFGDVEAILAEPNTLVQGRAAIRTLARSAGTLALPSWAYEKISVADGLMITEKVLPSFL